MVKPEPFHKNKYGELFFKVQQPLFFSFFSNKHNHATDIRVFKTDLGQQNTGHNWLAVSANFPPCRSPNNVCIAAVISEIIGKIARGAKNEGADREQGGKEECKPHSEG